MAYEEKRTSDEAIGLEPILKFLRQLIGKWWLIVIFVVAFSVSGFGIAKLTYSESYTSNLIFNVSNKDRDVVGAAGTYTTASDAQASTTIATNFKTLIQRGNDFITAVQANVKAQTGKTYGKEQLRDMMNVELVADSTLINITVKSEDKELAYVVATAIQSVYPEIAKNAFPTANISVADSATQSELAADSSTLLYTAAGFIIGAALAVIIILITAKIQNKLLSTEDIKNRFNIDIIATVSDIKNKKKGDRSRLLITDRNVGLPFIETFKLIRTKFENAKLKKGYSVFAITSSTESEGKTTCSTNIALSLAKSGKSVLLMDADLRKPAVCKTLGVSLEGEKGIYDIVTGNKTFEESVKYIEKYNLYLLVSASAVADPSETLASDAMAKIVADAKKNFDYVIIDCPPAGVVADAAIVANYTDTIVFVTAEEKVAIPQIEYALSDISTTKADIFGCIYNRAGTGTLKIATEKAGGYFSNRYGGYYGSSYYYGSRNHKKRK
ncbi:MAG: polysaccharide biosynthesis tyrosine autokinase [Clostridia bacterium]|nr:polysaccharide biosynthesis tyrosine autokinase [Clostridia bacterium]